MRTITFSVGLVVLTGCIIYSLYSGSDQAMRPFVPINIGYFIVISAAFISVALFKGAKPDRPRVRFEVYRQLSNGGLPFDDLMATLAKEVLTQDSSEQDQRAIQTIVCSMLDQGYLALSDGKIKVAEQGAASDR